VGVERFVRKQAVARLWRWRVVVYLVLGLLALDRAMAARAALWRAYDPQFSRDRVRYAKHRVWDLVIAGGSPAMCVDSGDLKGLVWQGRRLDRTLNLAVPYATTTDVYHTIEHGLPTPPALLVYAIAVTDLNGARIEAMSPDWLMDRRDIGRWVSAHPENTELCLRHYLQERLARGCALCYWRDGIRRWAADEAEALCPGFCPDAAREARERLGDSAALQAGIDFHPARPVPPRYRYNLRKASGEVLGRFGPMEKYDPQGHLPYLEAIVDWTEQHHCPLLLVNVPVTHDLEQTYPEAFTSYRRVLLKLQGRRDVRVILATRDDVGLTDADYEDQLHLNGDGSLRYGAWLRRTVSALSASQREESSQVVPAVPLSHRSVQGLKASGAS
jgi:hypothetical protein